MANVTIRLWILIAFVVGVILLQIFFSKKENKWLGLIFPIISFLFSLIVILNLLAPIVAFQLIAIFLISNIPTAILMLIYFTCRQKFKKRQEIDKMNIQDLE